MEDRGNFLNIVGAPTKAKQYVLSKSLVRRDDDPPCKGAALFSPLRVLVYEANDQSTRIEFDEPSSLFGQCE